MAGDCKSFPFGLAGVLQAEVIQLGGGKCVGYVSYAFPEKATYIEGTCLEVGGESSGVGKDVQFSWVLYKLLPPW